MKTAAGLCLLAALGLARALLFELTPGAVQCIAKNAERGQHIRGSYTVSENPGIKNTLEVRSTDGHLYYSQAATSGPLSVVPDAAGKINFCFRSEIASTALAGHGLQEVHLNFKDAFAASTESDTSSQTMSTLERQLKALSFYSKRINDGYARIMDSESLHALKARVSSTKVVVFGGLGLVAYAALAFLQVCYLKIYFKKKKLI